MQTWQSYIALAFLLLISFQCSGLGRLEWLPPDKKETIDLKYGIYVQISKEGISFYSSGFPDPMLSLQAKEPFLGGAQAETSVGYRMAAFSFKERILRKCNRQTISRIERIGEGFQISGELLGNDCSTGYRVKFIPKGSRELFFHAELDNPELNRISFTVASDPNERIFGLGEQFSNFDFKGKKPFLFTEEQGIGRGDEPITTGANIVAGAGGNEYTTYAPIPHYITTRNRQVFYENTGYSVFDFMSSDRIRVSFWDPQLEGGLKGTVWIGSNPRELISAYTAKTGRMPRLPDWAYGTILGLQGGSKKVIQILREAKSYGNPVTALWIQDWCGRRVTGFGDQLAWRWYADERLYPDFQRFVKERNADGIKVLGYVNPFLADADPKKKGGDDFRNPLLEEARKSGYLVKNEAGEDYLIQTVGFPAYLVDLTNPQAVKWLKGIIKKNMIDVGLSGWMADFGEWLPYDAVLHSGISARIYHNRYPVDWAKLNREVIREAGKEGEIVFFTRAGYSYSNMYSTLFWLGDQMVSFQPHDGLPSAVLGMVTSGMSGLSLNHSDIGGYTTISNPLKNYHRSKELLLRWSEMSAFSPIFRTHEGNRPLKNWQVYEYTNEAGEKSLSDRETGERFAAMGRLHYALRDYIRLYVHEAADTGLPVVRHPYLHYPDDINVIQLKYQYLLGEDLMVLPVVKSGRDFVRGYLPRGTWKHVWSGKIYEGPSHVEVSSPLGQPGAFIRLGSKNENLLERAFQKFKN